MKQSGYSSSKRNNKLSMAGGKCSLILLPLSDLNVYINVVYMFKSTEIVYIWYQSHIRLCLAKSFPFVLKIFKSLGASILTLLIKNKIRNILETIYKVFLHNFSSFLTSKFV